MKKIGLLLVVLYGGISLSVLADEVTLVPFRKMLTESGYLENGETRRQFYHLIVASTYPSEEQPFHLYRQRSDGRLVQFELRKGIREWYLIFRNQRGFEPYETFPLWGRGTWILKKNLFTGDLIQAKIFLQDNQDSFIRLFPHGKERSRLDVHLYGKKLNDDVIIPLPFSELMRVSLAKIVEMTEQTIRWKSIIPNPHSREYRKVESFVKKLDFYSEQIIEIDDAAIDGGGLNVFIETQKAIPSDMVSPNSVGMNCSGYIKWVADSIFSSWGSSTGRQYSEIDSLRQPTERTNNNAWNDFHSVLEQDARNNLDRLVRDPYFGLDWTRNLAWLLESARMKMELSKEQKQELSTGNIKGIPYQKNMGYPLEDLVPVLYQLAIKYPGAVYFAAINSRFRPEASVGEPEPLSLHQYWHVLILAPWFESGIQNDRMGHFRIGVLDTGGVELTLLSPADSEKKFPFLQKYWKKATEYAKLGKGEDGEPIVPEVMVHLVRVMIPPEFQPLPLSSVLLP